MQPDSITFLVQPGGTLRGTARVPGDKSISHRAIMLGAVAEGTTRITGFLEAEDCLATMNAFRAMGVTIARPEPGHLLVQGVGLHGLRAAAEPLYLGNSGTSMRLLAGLLAGQPFDSVLTGDASLSRRPMQRITEPLRRMGARLDTSPTGTAPLRIHGGAQLQGIRYALPVASAQVKSCLLLAGLYATSATCLREPAPTRDHTERMLAAFACPLRRDDGWICLEPGAKPIAGAIDVPGDLSSAAFFLVGAAIAEDAELTLEHVGINPTRSGVLEILQRMGADLEILNPGEAGGEPVADIRIRSSRLHGIDIPEALVPLAIDEFPALLVAAACAEGETRLSGAAELRVKESDRIDAMAEGLKALGIDARPTADGMVVRGGRPQGGTVASRGDHRIAMALSMAALRADGPVIVTDCANVNTSFPNFAVLARSLGLPISTVSGERP
ncbi:3-phosphoshikimate 1-carboxyvinyltransferase [Candidatus Methylocalor cossyra]|uniref:3-phosphoshikimate 1-carboxyvinyltransferase n=1 Tax=Candidatus Methylocalor cossyra TaxID=3108543 RepID=A0ABM9NM79_9GAMM